MRTAHLLSTLAVTTLATATAVAEDVFSLLEPEAFAAVREAESGPPAAEPIATEDAASSVARPAQALELIPAPTLAPTPSRSPEPLEAGALATSIQSLTLDAAPDRQLVDQMRKIPDNFAIKDPALDRFGAWQTPAAEATLTPPRFAPTGFAFAAPAVYSRPLYFEQPNLERYGHRVALGEHDCLSQSALSAAHFFATAAVLPYKMGAEHPDECCYVLGAYRPGSCNPHQLTKPEASLGGLTLEGVAVTGLIFLIP